MVACADGAAPSHSEVIDLIGSKPEERLRGGRISTYRVAFSWGFEGEDASAWEAHGVDGRFEVIDDALWISSSGRDPRISRRTRLDASQIDAVRVRFASPPRSSVQLFWAREGESFAPERSVVWRPDGGHARFDLGAHSLWTGEISSLRVDPTNTPGETVRLRAVEGLRKELREDALEEVVRDAWRVELDQELRDALVAPVGRTIAREIGTVPSDARLHFAYGLWREVADPGQPPDPVKWTLSVKPEGDEAIPVLRWELDPRDPEAVRTWHEAVVDLSEFAGEEATLLLRTRAARPDPLRALPVWANPEIVSRGRERPHVILVSLDTLRADHLSLYGYERETSPNLDRWAGSQATTFEQAVVQASSTLPSHVTMLSGMDPLEHGVNYGSAAPEELVLLPERLKQLGYETVAMTGGAFLDPRYGLAQGFDVYRYWGSESLFDEDEMRVQMDRALEVLHHPSRRPFFLFFHTYEIHSPFRAREPFYTRFGGGRTDDREAVVNVLPRGQGVRYGFRPHRDLVWSRRGRAELPKVAPEEMEQVVRRYDSGIAYADSQLARLFDWLERSDLDRQTLVIVTSDHGESFGEHGQVAHGHLYDHNLLVPLVIRAPGGAGAGRRVTDQVRIMDIPATVLDYAGGDPPDDLPGRSLRAHIDGTHEVGGSDIAVSYMPNTNFGLALRVDGRLKYIFSNAVWDQLRGSEELYNLKEDREESQNLVGAEEVPAEALREEALRRLAERPGLRIYFRNAEERAFEGRLQSELVKGHNLKTHTMGCACVSWAGRGEIRFSVPAGEEFYIVVEEARAAQLAFRLSTEEPGQAYEVSFLPPAPGESREILLDGGEWREGSSSDEETGILVSWEGDAAPRGRAPTEQDQSLRRRLESLGYIR